MLLLVDRPDLPLRCSSRSAGRCGAAPSARGTAGTSPVVGARSASCVRRFAVRVLECRRFGFGMISLSWSAVYGRVLASRLSSGASRGSSHARRAVARARCSGSCRTAGTARGSPPGTAASSAAPDRTARAAARSGRSGRPGSSWSRDPLRRLRARRPPTPPTPADTAGRTARRPAADTARGTGCTSARARSATSPPAGTVLVLVDVEVQLDRRHDPVGVALVRRLLAAGNVRCEAALSGCR